MSACAREDGSDWVYSHYKEIEEAREVQRRLVPRFMTWVPVFDIAADGQPARTLSGDCFDLLDLPGPKLALSIADVSGKGLPAALLAAHLQALVRASANSINSPADMCCSLNREIYQRIGMERFVSFFYGLVDGATSQLIYANAGHNPPLLMRCDGSVLRLEEGGTLLGIIENTTYAEGRVRLHRGDRLLLYTDGVTDAVNPRGQEFGERRLVEFLREHRHLSAWELQDRLSWRITSFSAGELTDDTTIVAVAVDTCDTLGPQTLKASVGAAAQSSAGLPFDSLMPAPTEFPVT